MRAQVLAVRAALRSNGNRYFEASMDQDKKTVVLVADDEPSTLAMVSSHLRSKGYSVLEASDGDQAWELAHEHLPHLVVLDVMMPGMSGWEVCRKIREAVSLAHTGVIMLTGIGENLNEMTSPLYGADAHVDKPFEFSNLDRKIAATLERRRAGEVGRGHDSEEPPTARKRAQKPANGVDRPTLPAVAPPPAANARRKLRILTPKPLVKAQPGRKPAAKKSAAAKTKREATTNTQRISPRAKTTTAARATRGSAKRQVRTSTMKDKPRAKTTAAKKAPAAKPVAKKAAAKAAARAPRAAKAKPGKAAKGKPSAKAARKAAPAPAKALPVKKAPAKKSAPAKATKKTPAAKKSTKKASPAKAPVAALKKGPAKKAPAKKAPAKPAPAPVAKKAPAKKAAAKPAPAPKKVAPAKVVAAKAPPAPKPPKAEKAPKPEKAEKAPKPEKEAQSEKPAAPKKAPKAPSVKPAPVSEPPPRPAFDDLDEDGELDEPDFDDEDDGDDEELDAPASES